MHPLCSAQRLLIVLIGFVLAACTPVSNVMVDYDTETDFSAFRAYDWLAADSKVEEGFDPLIAQRVQEALKTELFSAGFNEADSKPDVLVRYQVTTHTRQEPPKSSGSVGFGGSSGGNSAMGLSLSFPIGDKSVVKEANLVIDLVDPADKKLKWRGSKIIKISEESPEEITAVIDAAVAEIFGNYPPGSAP
ncbi:DUF4136 domain-containing protein [Oceanicoccus sagamiensis]|uniref:DUF4136 domain-containing protein n=1 Tax=Oceanicoccus sagamiensis TaxID=716816 RepID=A0A1X9NE98_9GAMM|nr:DUF4136 domain-containing protein [Oceanicoccus sagamiensis]ARN74215.1 hypothetical protein BST96_08830 [Oceanicoccus sagamiensis]